MQKSRVDPMDRPGSFNANRDIRVLFRTLPLRYDRETLKGCLRI